MKKIYATPTTEAIKVRIENNLLNGSEVTVTEEENNEGYDAKEETNFGW